MKKVLVLLKPYKVQTVVAWLTMLIELFVELYHPLLMGRIIDEGVITKDIHTVFVLGAIMIGVSFLGLTAGIINSFYAAHVGQTYGYDLRQVLFEKVQAFSFKNFSQHPTANLITRMTNDVTQVQQTIFMGLRVMLRAPLLIIGGMVMAFFVNVKLACILTVTLPILVIFLIWVLKKGGKMFRQVQARVDGVNNVMRENLTGMRLIRAFVRRGHETERFSVANQELRDRTFKTFQFMEGMMPILLLVMNFSILIVLWVGHVEIKSNQVELGQIVSVVNYGTRMSGALMMLTWIIMGISRFGASARRIGEVLDTEIDLVDLEGYDEKLKINEGKITFDHVSFHYPDHPTPVLEEISFTAEAGKTLAILGATGSGKTTLFQLIPRLYDVTEGRVLIDGHDVREMELKVLRRQIGFVPQEALLFTGTVSENIAFGKEGATTLEMVQAAKDAQIHNTIMKLPNGYETRIGQKGINLSGGQKQRLSIARALVRKPKILLLDDSTSALDLKTESKLLQALKKYTCTTLIITQKIGTAMAADSILLIEDGRILSQGSHDELLRKSPLYQRIYESQFGEGALKDA